MRSPRSPFVSLVCLGLATMLLGAVSLFPDQPKPADQVPDALHGIKVYHLPTKGAKPEPNLGIYRTLEFHDINFQRLQFGLNMSIRPVDHTATVERMYFQDVRVNGIPVRIDSFTQEFKLSNKDAVDVPAPLNCSIVFADLDSFRPVRDLVDTDSVLITGQNFVELRLSGLARISLWAKRVVVPVPLNERVPLNLFQGNPLLHSAAASTLDNLVNPSSAAAINMAKEHLAKMQLDKMLGGKAKPALYLLLTQYQVRDPKSKASEQFSQAGTGFVVSQDGKLLTSKRVIMPWKFDPQVAFLLQRQHMVLEQTSVKTYAWPAGAQVTGLDGQPNFHSALSSEQVAVRTIQTAPDEMVQQDYQDPDSGQKGSIKVHGEGAADVALLQLGGKTFVPLSLPDPPADPAREFTLVLCSYPFGMSQPLSVPRLLGVHASLHGTVIKMEHNLDPGETGAPLLDTNGNVVALAGSGDEGIPIQAARRLIP